MKTILTLTAVILLTGSGRAAELGSLAVTATQLERQNSTEPAEILPAEVPEQAPDSSKRHSLPGHGHYQPAPATPQSHGQHQSAPPAPQGHGHYQPAPGYPQNAIDMLVFTLENDQSWSRRQAAAAELGRMGPQARRAASNLLKAELFDADMDVRRAAAAARAQVGLDEYEASEVLPDITRLMTYNPSKKNRIRAAGVLAELGSLALPAASDLLRVKLDDEDQDVRKAAASALNYTGLDSDEVAEVLPHILEVLRTEVLYDAAAKEKRIRAARLLGDLGALGEPAIDHLSFVARYDTDTDICHAAESALAAIRRQLMK